MLEWKKIIFTFEVENGYVPQLKLSLTILNPTSIECIVGGNPVYRYYPQQL